jgi:hypothetical protein
MTKKFLATLAAIFLSIGIAHADTADTTINLIEGLVGSIAVKAPVKIVSTTNIVLSGEQTIDSIALTEGDRVLVTGQTDAIENGIYSVSTSAWQRTNDFNGRRDATYGTLVAMQEGTYQSCMFQLQTEDPTIGTDELTWALHSCVNTVVLTNSDSTTNTITGSDTLSATCNQGDLHFHTDELVYYVCTATDTWTLFSSTFAPVDRKCIWFENPTADDDFKTIWSAEVATTLTSISCETDQTVNFDLQIDDGTPADVNGSDIACTSTWVRDILLSGVTAMDANDKLDLAIESVSGTPTWVSICWGIK